MRCLLQRLAQGGVVRVVYHFALHEEPLADLGGSDAAFAAACNNRRRTIRLHNTKVPLKASARPHALSFLRGFGRYARGAASPCVDLAPPLLGVGTKEQRRFNAQRETGAQNICILGFGGRQHKRHRARQDRIATAGMSPSADLRAKEKAENGHVRGLSADLGTGCGDPRPTSSVHRAPPPIKQSPQQAQGRMARGGAATVRSGSYCRASRQGPLAPARLVPFLASMSLQRHPGHTHPSPAGMRLLGVAAAICAHMAHGPPPPQAP